MSKKRKIIIFVITIIGSLILIGTDSEALSIFGLLMFIFSASGLFLMYSQIEKERVEKSKQSKREDFETAKFLVEELIEFFRSEIKKIYFSLCSKCKDNNLNPLRMNNSGSAMEFSCATCNKKKWYSFHDDANKIKLLDAWNEIENWNYLHEGYYDLSFSFSKLKEKEKDNSRVKSFNTHEEEQKYGQILDLKGKVSISDIRNAYKKKIVEYHPDKVERMGGEIKKLAQKLTKEINEAYEFFKKKHGV